MKNRASALLAVLAVTAMIPAFDRLAFAADGPAASRPTSRAATSQAVNPKSARLGELVLSMSPKTSMEFSAAPLDGQLQNRGMTTTTSPTLTADQSELERLLNEGADPMAVRIAGFEPAGARPIGNGLSIQSTGKPGTVAGPDASGLTLYDYCKLNKLEGACKALAAHGGDAAPKEIAEVRAALAAAASGLRDGNNAKFLALMPAPAVEPMKAMLAAQALAAAKTKRLQTAAKDKGLQAAAAIPNPQGPADAVQQFAEATFESGDGTATAIVGGSRNRFARADGGWQMELPQEMVEQMPLISQMTEASARMADELADGIEKGQVTDDNFMNKVRELSAKHLQPIMEKASKAASQPASGTAEP